MALEVNGKTIETDDHGNLADPHTWDQDVAMAIAAADDTMGELTQEHFDVLKYLREEFFNNNGNQPMERQINKDMGKIWGKKISSKDLYNLFRAHRASRATGSPGCPTSIARVVTDHPMHSGPAPGWKRQPPAAFFVSGGGFWHARWAYLFLIARGAAPSFSLLAQRKHQKKRHPRLGRRWRRVSLRSSAKTGAAELAHLRWAQTVLALIGLACGARLHQGVGERPSPVDAAEHRSDFRMKRVHV